MPKYDIKPGGYYGEDKKFGGQYIPEVLLPGLKELEKAFYKYKDEADFLAELDYYNKNLTGRPSPLIFAENLTKKIGGAKIYLKNEGNNFTGSHKINHCLYQILLAKRLGKKRIICETGAGQHGLAVATVCAKFGLECVVYMGTKSIAKQYPNVFWMKQLGAKIVPVSTGGQGLTDAAEACIADWIGNPDSYFLLGSVVGPHPYPEITRTAQSIISKEIQSQLQELENKDYPDAVVACIGGGSNAIGAFNQFLYNDKVRLIGVEAGGSDPEVLGKHAARIQSADKHLGVFEGFKSYFLTNKLGQIATTSSISAGLDYVGIGPIHAYLWEEGRLEIKFATDKEVIEAFKTLAKEEAILGALESCHAVAEGLKQANNMGSEEILVINVSGRADNYIFNVAGGLKDSDFTEFCHDF